MAVSFRPKLVVDDPVALPHTTAKHQVLNDLTIATTDAGKTPDEFVRRKPSQKPQLPQVNPKDGHLVSAHLTRGSQDGSVTAQDNRQVAGDFREASAEFQIDEQDLGVLGDDGFELSCCLPHVKPFTAGQDYDARPSAALEQPARRSRGRGVDGGHTMLRNEAIPASDGWLRRRAPCLAEKRRSRSSRLKSMGRPPFRL